MAARKNLGVTMDADLLVWLDAWRGHLPRSRILEKLVQLLRDTVQAQAETVSQTGQYDNEGERQAS